MELVDDQAFSSSDPRDDGSSDLDLDLDSSSCW